MFEQESTGNVSIRGMLKFLPVSRSGYVSWKKRKQEKLKSEQAKRKEMITAEIKKIYESSHEIYGSPKITHILQSWGHLVSQKYVANIMRENGMKAHYVKKYRTRTTIHSDFSTKLKNVLDRKFNPDKPNRVWVTDITYVWTHDEGFVYLTSLMDLYSRKIIAWTLSQTMQVEEVLACLKKAKQRRQYDEALVIHSDRGVHFVSALYRQLTSNMTTSYSDKGNPYDNACIEAFHALIKREWFSKYPPLDFNHAYRLTFEYIETFYNTIRTHSHCDYMSPNKFEQKIYLGGTFS
jgi:putative transposase